MGEPAEHKKDGREKKAVPERVPGPCKTPGTWSGKTVDSVLRTLITIPLWTRAQVRGAMQYHHSRGPKSLILGEGHHDALSQDSMTLRLVSGCAGHSSALPAIPGKSRRGSNTCMALESSTCVSPILSGRCRSTEKKDWLKKLYIMQFAPGSEGFRRSLGTISREAA